MASEKDKSRSRGEGFSEQEGTLSGLAASSQEDAERQFRQTCEKIKEIEERARHRLRALDVEHCCSFCNRSSSETGSLCQPDDVDVCICLQCAELALKLLREQGG